MSIVSSPNMLLPVPVVGVEQGPDWASDLNSCMAVIDQHDHSTGSGVPITPSGLNISSDLTFNNNNATSLRSVRFQTQASLLSLPTDLGCLYRSGVDLYFNDGLGNQIRITQSGGVAGTSGSISNLVPPASASYVSGSKTFVWQSDANTPANTDTASVVLRNLVANSKGLTLAPPAAMGADYTLVLPSLPLVQNIMTLDSSGNIGAPWNVDNATIEVASNNLRIKNNGVTTAKIADGQITEAKMAPMPAAVYPTSAGAGEIGISASTSNGTTSSVTFVPVASVQITTTGRPVRLEVQSDGGGNSSYIGSSSTAFETYFYRDVTQLSRQSCGNGSTSGNLGVTITAGPGAGSTGNTTGSIALTGIIYPSSAFAHTDYSVPAGTYTYYFGVAATSGGTVSIVNLVLVVYEI